MEQWIILTSIFIFTAIWLVMRKGRGSIKAPANKTSCSFHGVTIQPCTNACYSVSTIERKRFLSNEVPLLPLNSCDRASCQCKYVHHTDRRSGQDRRYPTLKMQSSFSQQNKRSNQDRRQPHYA